MLCDLKILIKYFICVLISIGWYQTYTQKWNSTECQKISLVNFFTN